MSELSPNLSERVPVFQPAMLESLIYDTIKAKAISTGTILQAWSEDRKNLEWILL